MLAQKLVEHPAYVLDLLGEDMGHRTLALKPPGHPQAAPGDHRAAEAFIDLAPDDDVDDPRLVLGRSARSAAGGES